MKIAVIGAGVSGIVFAINRRMLYPEDKVYVFEHLDKALKKVLATGNGKCNIGNSVDITDQYNEKIIKDILSENNYYVQKEFLDSINIKTKLMGELSYPISESAVTVRNALLKAVEKHHIKLKLETEVLDYQVLEDGIYLKTDKDEYTFDKLVFACGGKSSPKLGSDGSIILLLEKHHYKLKEFRPVLCPICTKNKTKDADGTRVKAKVTVYDGDTPVFEELGEVMFKSDGLSGIVIFNATRYLKEKKPYHIKIDLLPDISKKELREFLIKHDKETLLATYLHPNLAKYILKSNPMDKDLIDFYLKGFVFAYDHTYGFENSHVSAGGIKFSDVNENLESRIEKNVYFLGELLNYDGPCGGYNLMWAIGSALYLSKRM